tara:strand:- start:880 stop:1914 length:1035 start_codon:yes stop_codon:yes gene_type:complete
MTAFIGFLTEIFILPLKSRKWLRYSYDVKMKHFKGFLISLYNQPVILLCIVTLGHAGNALSGKLATGEVSPMIIVFLRWSLVAFLLLFIQRKTLLSAATVLRTRVLWVFFMGGIGLAGFSAFFYLALKHTSVINVGIFMCTMPAFILLGTLIFFKNKISLIQLIGLMATMFGVIVVVSNGQIYKILSLTVNIGDLIILFGCWFYAGYSIGLKNRPKIANLTMMCFFSIAAAFGSIPFVLIEFVLGETQLPTATGWYLVAYIVLVPSLLSQVLFMRGIDLIGPGQAGLYMNLVPIFAAILGVTLLGETLEIFHIISLFIVFLGIYAFRYSEKLDKNTKEEMSLTE